MTDAKCPHQGGLRKRGNNHFDHLQNWAFGKMVKKQKEIYIYTQEILFLKTIYLYREMKRNDWKMIGTCLSDIYIYIGSHILMLDIDRYQWHDTGWSLGVTMLGLQWIELSSRNQHIQNFVHQGHKTPHFEKHIVSRHVEICYKLKTPGKTKEKRQNDFFTQKKMEKSPSSRSLPVIWWIERHRRFATRSLLKIAEKFWWKCLCFFW